MANQQFTGALERPDNFEVVNGHPLASAAAKFNRAVEHYLALVVAARAHMTATADNATVKQERTSPLEIRFFADFPAIPLRLSAMVGDVTHNLRAALDHLAWALAVRRGAPPNPLAVSYPICSTQAAFDKGRATFETFLAISAVDFIEGAQPFHGKPALDWLRDLDNVDKHEALVVVRHRLRVTSMTITDSDTGEPRLQKSTGDAEEFNLSDDGTLFRLRQEAPGVPRLAISARFENAVALSKHQATTRSWPADRLDLILRQLLHDVEEVLLDARHRIESCEL